MMTPSEAIASDIAELFAFLEFNELDREDSKEMWEKVLGPQIDETLNRFYEGLNRFRISGLIPPSRLAALKVSQREHWRRLFNSEFDAEYVNSVRRIGIRHREIGIDPGWYVASYSHIRIEFFSLVLASTGTMIEKRRMVRLVEKYVALDMALALSTYTVSIID